MSTGREAASHFQADLEPVAAHCLGGNAPGGGQPAPGILPHRAAVPNPASWIPRADCADSTRLPLNGFTPSWTLSSKFFSTFPEGTCRLSVSCRYLALDGVYHLLWAAFPTTPAWWGPLPASHRPRAEPRWEGHRASGLPYATFPQSARRTSADTPPSVSEQRILLIFSWFWKLILYTWRFF